MRKVSVKKYAQALYELTEDLPKEQVKVEIANFLKLIFRNKDGRKIDQIAGAFEAYAKKQASIIDVQVVSAEILSNSQKENLKDQLKKEQKVKTVNLLEKIDKNLLGGFILKIGDTIFDASIKTQLEELNEKMKRT